jgi:predicted RecB family nuclease
MIITREIFRNYLDCKFKAFLKLSPDPDLSKPNQYALLTEELEGQYRTAALQQLFPNARQNVEDKPIDKMPPLTAGADVILSARFINQNFNTTVDALEKVNGKSFLGTFHYQPIITLQSSTVSTKDKLALGFLGVVIAASQGRAPQFGKIIHGTNQTPLRIRLAKFMTRARTIVESLSSEKESPKLFLNQHCKQCEYQTYCWQRAKEKDDLSLLSRISLKEVESLNKRGIFTVTQLSHKFRPQRRHKGLEQKRKPHSYSLQALAIREGKTHVYNCSPIPKSNVALFVDVECDISRKFYYLIGLKVRQGEASQVYQFWANQFDQEAAIFLQFLDAIRPFSHFKLFHFGSLEARFIKEMAKRLGMETDGIVQNILAAAVNIVEYTYSSIYFPTHSSDLKSLAGFLGFQWVHPEASGLQSIVWRHRWEQDKANELKETLLQYNRDDINALDLLATYTRKITTQNLEEIESRDIVNADALGSQAPIRWGKIQFASPEMSEINDCAYYDYQRDRVYFRTQRKRRTTISKKNTLRRRVDKVNRVIEIECRKCSACRSTTIERRARHGRLIVDIKFTRNGVKRHVTKLITWSYWCSQCQQSFLSPRYRPIGRQRMRTTYGHGLQSWVLFQHLVNNQSFATIDDDLIELFGINLGKATLNRFKTELSKRYSSTYENIKSDLLKSSVIVVDEAKMKLHDIDGYAWVFANSNNVLFCFRATRDGEFLRDFLKGFNGVLVTDFYAAYDSLPCKQQKCLIHLMRDLNEDVTKHPFDEELKKITRAFTSLLRETVSTIDEHGLKKSKLKQHLPAAKRFFDLVTDCLFSSEVAQKYQKRLGKNEDKLFTFLSHNHVPWNNNAAEHAIKHLARLRKRGMTSFAKARIDEYMSLISIYQTCEYRDISFLRFLLSGKKSL